MSDLSANIHPDALVAEILERWPSTARVFLKYRMACVGCGMSIFETLSSAAEIYQLPLDELTAELEAALSGEVGSPGVQ